MNWNWRLKEEQKRQMKCHKYPEPSKELKLFGGIKELLCVILKIMFKMDPGSKGDGVNSVFKKE